MKVTVIFTGTAVLPKPLESRLAHLWQLCSYTVHSEGKQYNSPECRSSDYTELPAPQSPLLASQAVVAGAW